MPWEMRGLALAQRGDIGVLLAAGWEPFAVVEMSGWTSGLATKGVTPAKFPVVWFKRFSNVVGPQVSAVDFVPPEVHPHD